MAPVGTVSALDGDLDCPGGWMWTLDVPAGQAAIEATLTLTPGPGAVAQTVTNAVAFVDSDGTDGGVGPKTASADTVVESAADKTVTFATSITYLNGDDATVTAMLSCNAGLPLQQSFDISPGAPVNFTMTNLPFTTAGTECEITLDGLDAAYTATPASCMFTADPLTFAADGMNTCAFEVDTGAPTTLLIATDFDGVDDPNIDTSFTTELTCSNVSPDSGGPYGMATVSFVDIEDASVSWYAEPGETADCTVELMPESSAIQGDECTFSFDTSDATAGCTVVGTVFFEGIPTLSQYGMALMILLMLGVGFVGMRRIV